VAGAPEAARLVDLISRGYSCDVTAATDSLVLKPRPAGVLYLVSPLSRSGNIPTWIAHLPPSSFRQYLLAMDTTEDTYTRLASLCEGECWHLDAFVRRAGWAEFIMEFIASRMIDVVQVITARQGVDVVPALRAAYPFIRVVVDVDGEGSEDLAWMVYATSRYGNVIDAFFAPNSDVEAQLHRAGVSASRVQVDQVDFGGRDESAAAIHAEIYGRLLATALT
jgi:hypothetical protein